MVAVKYVPMAISHVFVLFKIVYKKNVRMTVIINACGIVVVKYNLIIP